MDKDELTLLFDVWINNYKSGIERLAAIDKWCKQYDLIDSAKSTLLSQFNQYYEYGPTVVNNELINTITNGANMYNVTQLLRLLSDQLVLQCQAKPMANNTWELPSDTTGMRAFQLATIHFRSVADIKLVKLTDKETKQSKYFLELTFN